MEKKKSVITEVGIFSIGIGFLLGLLAYFAITGIEDNLPRFLGIKRKYWLGAQIGGIALLNLISGIVVLAARTKFAISLSIVSAVLVTLSYFAFIILSGVRVPFDLPTIVVVIMPFLVIARSMKAMKETEDIFDTERPTANKE